MTSKLLRKWQFLFGTKVRHTFVFRGHDGRRDIVHRGTKADRGVIREVFLHEGYATEKSSRGGDLREHYRAIVASGRVPLIIDAGANIGASAVWFANTYPLSHVVAIEPEASNFALLECNCAGLNVHAVKAAIGSSDGRVALIDPGRGEWAYQTETSETGECEQISVRRLIDMKKAEGYVPFIMKVDIEGGERDLFDGNGNWIDEFALVVIELHDWLFPRKAMSKNFLTAVSARDRDFVYKGECVFSFRN